jgi:murein DD-endopeptidase MepM/ murein hydrolase activator NlpD
MCAKKCRFLQTSKIQQSVDKFKYLLIPFITYFSSDYIPGYLSESKMLDSAGVEMMYFPESIYDENIWELDTASHFQEFWDNEICHVEAIDLSKIDTTIWLCVINEMYKNYAIPTDGAVRSAFKWRKNRFHYGVDLPLQTGDTVYAAFDGKVRYARRNFGGYGNLVIIRHHNELETYYAHFSQILVEPDQMVRAGEPIGLGGSTGRSTGPHLHFEVRYLGNAINPELIFDFENQTIRDENLVITKDLFGHKAESVARKYYKVRSGDTLYSIAKRNGTTVNQLRRINGIGANGLIRTGQVLRVR